MDHRRSAGRAKVDRWRDVDHPGATKDRPDRLSLADHPLHRHRAAVRVRSGRHGIRRGRAPRSHPLRHSGRRSVTPRRAMFVPSSPTTASTILRCIIWQSSSGEPTPADSIWPPRRPACSRSLSGCRPTSPTITRCWAMLSSSTTPFTGGASRSPMRHTAGRRLRPPAPGGPNDPDHRRASS